MPIKVSVVVPIYKVEKYLRQCVDSILAQTLKEIEIILVDDGSPDSCPHIIDEYAAKDCRVVPVHQENGGYGRAVNHGVGLARGEYIGIIESDDWIEPTMYEKLYNKAKQLDSDIVKADFFIYNSQNTKAPDNPYDQKSSLISLNEAPDGSFTVRECPQILAYHASLWSNLYRADFIREIPMNETASASYQDFPFIMEVLSRARRITVVKECLVHYRMESGQNSSTMRRDERLLMMPIQCVNGLEVLKKCGTFEDVKDAFYFHAYRACAGFYKDIYWRHKRAYLTEFQKIFKDAEGLSKNPYLTTRELRSINHIRKGNFYRSIFNGRDLRRMIISLHIDGCGVALQIFGVRIIIGTVKNRPALVTFDLNGIRRWFKGRS